MSLIHNLKHKKISSFGFIKIFIIILVSVYLIGGFEPFYIEHSDDYLYGFGAVNIANGSYEYTNEFLQNSEYDGVFYFGPFIKTIHNTLIPNGAIGIYGLAAISYFLGGYYALFYLGPISAILTYIISERVISKLFGGFAGLVALIFFSMNGSVMYFGDLLLSDHIFTLLLILGTFFLIKFLNEKTNSSILLCSSFFTAATFFRYNGAIFLPIEILIVLIFFLFKYFKTRKGNNAIRNSSKLVLNLIKSSFKIEIKKIVKISLYILGPWSIFFIFLFSFNIYYFDEPFTTYWEERTNIEKDNVILSFFIFDSERFESIEWYFSLFLATQHNALTKLSVSLDVLDQFLLSIISFLLLFSAVLISLKFKINRKEIIVFSIVIVSLLLFYSSKTIVSVTGTPIRYMIPLLPFYSAILGYLMYRAWTINFQKIPIKKFPIFSTSWKVFLIVTFAILLFSSLYYSKPVDHLFIKQDFHFKDPKWFADTRPLDKEGLTEKSVILYGQNDRVKIWDYDAIPFNPFRGYSEETQSWSDNEAKAQSIKVMNGLFDKGYKLYVFKHKDRGDPYYYKYLEEEHQLILMDYSKTFCKLVRIEHVNGENNNQMQSDDICHTFLYTEIEN